MKRAVSLACALVVGLSAGLSALAADPVQPPPQPPSAKPPTTLPPGSTIPPGPNTPSQPGVDITRRNTDTTNSTTANTSAPRSDADSREMEKVKNMAKTSQSFVNAAAQAGMLEVELGKIAASKGSNQQIKDFGKHMQTDHEKANNELKRVAKASNVKVPEELDAEHKAKLDALKAKTGPQFDAAYAEAMAKDHDKAVALFREASTASGVDSNLQAFAKKTLPTLEEHKSTAKQLHAGTAALSTQPKVTTDTN